MGRGLFIMSLFHVVSQWKFYLEVVKRFRQAERRKRPVGWRNKTWMLHHSASAHTLLLICEFLAKHDITVVPQLFTFPDLAPAGFIKL
jgi:hypothetical protein